MLVLNRWLARCKGCGEFFGCEGESPFDPEETCPSCCHVLDWNWAGTRHTFDDVQGLDAQKEMAMEFIKAITKQGGNL
jgi:hypothetical protein